MTFCIAGSASYRIGSASYRIGSASYRIGSASYRIGSASYRTGSASYKTSCCYLGGKVAGHRPIVSATTAMMRCRES
jgi:hypothetical protein